MRCALIAEGWALAGDDLAAQARLLTAEAFDGASRRPGHRRARRAARSTLARRIGDPLIESAALDQLTAVQLARGEVRAAAASAVRRTELLAPLPVTPAAGLEFFDAYVMAAECAVAAGDLRGARRLAERLRDLPFYREEGHLATARLLVVTVLAGDWDEAVGLADRFREGWERAGRPRAGQPEPRRLRRRDRPRTARRRRRPGRRGWTSSTLCRHRARPWPRPSSVSSSTPCSCCIAGCRDQAVQVLTTPPGGVHELVQRPVAPLVRGAVGGGGGPVAATRMPPTGWNAPAVVTADNPIAAAIVDRAAALAGTGDGRDALGVAAAAFEQAGCRYQWARTLVLMGGQDRAAAARRCWRRWAPTPMVWPPE